MNRQYQVTYNLPKNVLNDLNTFVDQEQRNQFVVDAVKAALELIKQSIEEDYIAASLDKKRSEEISAWPNT